MSPPAACPSPLPSTGPPAQPGGGGQRVEQPPGGLEFGPRACHWAGRACGDHLLPPASASRESLTQAWQLLRDRQVGAHPWAYGRMYTGRGILHNYPGGDIRAAGTVVPGAIYSPRACTLGNPPTHVLARCTQALAYPHACTRLYSSTHRHAALLPTAHHHPTHAPPTPIRAMSHGMARVPT